MRGLSVERWNRWWLGCGEERVNKCQPRVESSSSCSGLGCWTRGLAGVEMVCVEGLEAGQITGVCNHPVRLQDPRKPCHIRPPNRDKSVTK